MNLIEDPKQLGYPEWGAGSISDKDWSVIKKSMVENDVKTVVEVGPGLSTMLMMQMVDSIVCYEHDKRHIERMQIMVNGKVEIRWWDSIHPFELDGYFDMAFIDSPHCGWNRKPSVQSVVHKCDLLVIHDAGYAWRDKWRYELDPDLTYEGILTGGRLGIWKKIA